MQRLWIAAFVLLAVISKSTAAEEPNILLIVADDLGFSDLGCYGGEISTPNLDRLATGGVRFTQCYNMARCCPTRASLLTGQYPHKVGFPLMNGSLPKNCVTIPEALKPEGYRPFMTGKWHLGRPGPFARGFEEYYGLFDGWASMCNPAQYVRRPQGRVPRTYQEGKFYATDAFTDHALDFIQLARDDHQPWFLYLAHSAPHFPLHAPQELVDQYVETYRAGWDAIREQRFQRLKELGVVRPEWQLAKAEPLPANWVSEQHGTSGQMTPRWESLDKDRREDLARRMAVYAAMIESMDSNIGRVVDDLKKHGELDNTLIMFLSDNGACAEWDPYGFDTDTGPQNVLHKGDELAKMGGPGTFHSYGSGWAIACNAPFRLFKHYCHEGGISSPLIVHWPNRVAANVRGKWCHEPAHVIDILPTCLAAAGAVYPAKAHGTDILPKQGISLLPAIDGYSVDRKQPLFFEHEKNRAVRAGDWKLVSVGHGEWELYNTAADRTEQNNLAAKEPERVKRLAAAYTAWAKENHVPKE